MQDLNSIEISIPNAPNPLIINIDDLHFFQNHKWTYHKKQNRLLRCARKERRTKYIYHDILESKKGDFVDHINSNTMDNRRCNLRITNQRQNLCNRNKRSAKKYSKYFGVSFNKRRNKYVAQIRDFYSNIFIGHFDNEIEAAKAYDKKCLELRGKFAQLNFLNAPY